jgi:TonB family protein
MGRLQVENKKFFQVILSVITFLHVFFLKKNLGTISSQQIAERTPLLIKVINDISHRRQIVQSDDSMDRQQKEGAFLSDKTRSFDRQVKAKDVHSFSSGKKKESLSLSQLGENRNPFELATRNSAGEQRSSANDHLPHIPPGDLSQLNTVEHKYFGFYHRIRQKLEQFWGRSIQQKAQELASEGRQIASADAFITSLRITLDDRGRVIHIELTGASGVRELDEAAIESFNEAGPFPNPPKDLIVNGRVVLEWGFVVNT